MELNLLAKLLFFLNRAVRCFVSFRSIVLPNSLVWHTNGNRRLWTNKRSPIAQHKVYESSPPISLNPFFSFFFSRNSWFEIPYAPIRGTFFTTQDSNFPRNCVILTYKQAKDCNDCTKRPKRVIAFNDNYKIDFTDETWRLYNILELGTIQSGHSIRRH